MPIGVAASIHTIVSLRLSKTIGAHDRMSITPFQTTLYCSPPAIFWTWILKYHFLYGGVPRLGQHVRSMLQSSNTPPVDVTGRPDEQSVDVQLSEVVPFVSVKPYVMRGKSPGLSTHSSLNAVFFVSVPTLVPKHGMSNVNASVLGNDGHPQQLVSPLPPPLPLPLPPPQHGLHTSAAATASFSARLDCRTITVVTSPDATATPQ